MEPHTDGGGTTSVTIVCVFSAPSLITCTQIRASPVTESEACCADFGNPVSIHIIRLFCCCCAGT